MRLCPTHARGLWTRNMIRLRGKPGCGTRSRASWTPYKCHFQRPGFRLYCTTNLSHKNMLCRHASQGSAASTRANRSSAVSLHAVDDIVLERSNSVRKIPKALKSCGRRYLCCWCSHTAVGHVPCFIWTKPLHEGSADIFRH